MQGALTAESGFSWKPSARRHRIGSLPQGFWPTLALALTLGLGSIGLLANAFGIASPMDFRAEFNEPLLPYSEAIAELDQAFSQQGASEQFLAQATVIVDRTSAYENRTDLRQIPAKENWVLWGLSQLQPMFNYFGMNSQTMFPVYQAMSYEMALKRGFGTCLQMALAVSDLLNTRYDVPTAIVDLGGHFVALAELPDGSQHILDSTVGIYLPYGPEEAAQRIEEFEPLYREQGWAELALTFDAARNQIHPRGARDAGPVNYYVERVSIFLKWFAPVALMLLGALLLKVGFGSSEEGTEQSVSGESKWPEVLGESKLGGWCTNRNTATAPALQ
jgi:hypothetical protein